MGSHTDYLERCSKVAIFGGTFDPIHNGHLTIAEAVLHQFAPQRVLFVPSGNPPHKPDRQITCANHRYNMVLDAVCNTPGFDVTRLEVDRTGASYTIDTIRAVKGLCLPGATIYFVLGQDALCNILSWKNAAELLTLCNFIVVPRQVNANNAKNEAELDAQLLLLRSQYGAKIEILKMPQLDVSSTAVRAALEGGAPIKAIVPPEVAQYARTHGLYGAPVPDMGDAHFAWASAQLERQLTPKRFKHTLGVVIEAERLAKHYGADTTKACWAALLHDCTKEYGVDKKHKLCERWGIKPDHIVSAHIDLAHGLLGAEAAQRYFYINDEEVLQAVRYHILGHAHMTLLDKIVLLADFIEPYRENYHPLQEMRKHAYTNINKALIIGLTAMREVDAARGKELHNWSADALKLLNDENTRGGNK